MYNESALRNDIAIAVNGKIDNEVEIGTTAITLAVIVSHLPKYKEGDSGFLAHCVWHTVRKSVGAYLARLSKDEEGSIVQQRLPGMEHVQKAYVVRRDGEDVAVPTMKLITAEVFAIAGRLRKESITKAAHADELLRIFGIETGR